jgi:hypothetical protein
MDILKEKTERFHAPEAAVPRKILKANPLLS